MGLIRQEQKKLPGLKDSNESERVKELMQKLQQTESELAESRLQQRQSPTSTLLSNVSADLMERRTVEVKGEQKEATLRQRFREAADDDPESLMSSSTESSLAGVEDRDERESRKKDAGRVVIELKTDVDPGPLPSEIRSLGPAKRIDYRDKVVNSHTSKYIKDDGIDQYDGRTPVADWLNAVIFRSTAQQWGHRTLFSVLSNLVSVKDVIRHRLEAAREANPERFSIKFDTPESATLACKRVIMWYVEQFYEPDQAEEQVRAQIAAIELPDENFIFAKDAWMKMQQLIRRLVIPDGEKEKLICRTFDQMIRRTDVAKKTDLGTRWETAKEAAALKLEFKAFKSEKRLEMPTRETIYEKAVEALDTADTRNMEERKRATQGASFVTPRITQQSLQPSPRASPSPKRTGEKGFGSRSDYRDRARSHSALFEIGDSPQFSVSDQFVSRCHAAFNEAVEDANASEATGKKPCAICGFSNHYHTDCFIKYTNRSHEEQLDGLAISRLPVALAKFIMDQSELKGYLSTIKTKDPKAAEHFRELVAKRRKEFEEYRQDKRVSKQNQYQRSYDQSSPGGGGPSGAYQNGPGGGYHQNRPAYNRPNYQQDAGGGKNQSS